MRHLGGCLLLAFLLALAAPAPASGKKAGLLDRLLAAATGAGGHRQALNGLGDMPLEELLQPPAAAFAPREDAWRVDPELRVLSKMMEGDFMGIFQILALDKELERVWSEPRAVAHVLKTMKVFEGVRGVPEIMAKADGDITKEDGMFVLGRIRELVKNYVEKSQLMSTPEGLQGLVARYQAKFADLYLALRPDAPGTAQDKAAAARRLQQAIADDVWGGLIDLDKFGLNGEAPVAIAEARDRMIEEAPQVWELVTQSDPFIKRVLQDPFRAAEFASEAFGIDAEMPPGFSMGQSAS